MGDSGFAVAVVLYAMGTTVVIWAAYPHADVRTQDADCGHTMCGRNHAKRVPAARFSLPQG